MKNLKIFAVVLFVMGMIAASCEGPEGPRGPAGAAGTNGTDGNANVMMFGFGDTTITSTLSLDLPISQGLCDSSIVLPYYSEGGFWYQMGEIGYGASFLTRYYLYTGYVTYTILQIGLYNVDGSAYTGTGETWDSIRVFVIPATQFYASEPEINFSDYYEVENYFDQK